MWNSDWSNFANYICVTHFPLCPNTCLCTLLFTNFLLKLYYTPGPNRDQPLRNEPMINSNKWMVVHVNWPKLKSYDNDYFDWIIITDFHKVIDCFLGVISELLQKTMNYFMKICNSDPIKKVLVI